MVYRKGTLDDKKCFRKTASYGRSLSESVLDIPFPLAVANKLLDDFGFSEMVDSILDWDPKQCHISPGDAFKAIILRTASVKERPAIMNLHFAYLDMPLRLMFDTVRCPDDLDRFAIADHLDRLYEAGVSRIYSNVSATVRAHYDVVSKVAHSDTTSVNVWGDYISDYQNDGGIDIVYGYSKDKRPDLKQFMVGNVVDDNGLIIYSKPLNGNTDDREWNRMCLDAIESLLKEEDLIYVADSKVVTEQLIRRMNDADIRFVSRLPKNFGKNLQRRILEDVDPDSLKKMVKLKGEEKRVDRWYTETVVENDGITLRAIPQVTSHNRGKGDKALEKQREGFKKELEAFGKLYACEKDAKAAFDKFFKSMRRKYPFIVMEPTYHKVYTESRPKGRPRKDGSDVIRDVMTRIEIAYTEDPDERDAVWKSEEFIVTISNIPFTEDDPVRGEDAENVLRHYNEQWRAEGSFATVKSPAFVDALFLEKQSRAEALVMLLNVGMLLRGLIQKLIRDGLKDIPDDSLPEYGVDNGRLQRNVTHSYFLNQFQSTNVHYFERAGEYVFSRIDTAKRAEFFMGLMGIDPSELFRTG